MILKGEIVAAHDIMVGSEVDPLMRDEFVGKGRVIWGGSNERAKKGKV